MQIVASPTLPTSSVGCLEAQFPNSLPQSACSIHSESKIFGMWLTPDHMTLIQLQKLLRDENNLEL
jgi:hypothetical protein